MTKPRRGFWSFSEWFQPVHGTELEELPRPAPTCEKPIHEGPRLVDTTEIQQTAGADPEVLDLLAERADGEIDPLLSDYTPGKARHLRALDIDPAVIRATFHNVEHHRAHMASTFFLSPFDEASLDDLLALGLATIKLGSGEITNVPLLERLGEALDEERALQQPRDQGPGSAAITLCSAMRFSYP